MFVDSASARVAPAAATDARAVPALIARNLLRTTPSVPMVTTESVRTGSQKISLIQETCNGPYGRL